MRVVIYTKDVEVLTGLTPRTARHILSQVRKHLNKPRDQFITIEEFCRVKGLSYETTIKQLNL